MLTTLEDLGWNSHVAESFAPHAAAGLVAARVSLEHTHIYRVISPAGEYLARVAGRLRHHARDRTEFPAVGDWVAIEERTNGEARILALLPRTSRFSRRGAGDPTQQQIVAANVDVVFLVFGARPRLQSPPNRALSPDCVGERRGARDCLEQE